MDDYVKIVRCKDCELFEINHMEHYGSTALISIGAFCEFWKQATSQDGFCHMGVKNYEFNQYCVAKMTTDLNPK